MAVERSRIKQKFGYGSLKCGRGQPGAGCAVDQIAGQMVGPAARGLPDIGHLHHGAARPMRRLGPGFAVLEGKAAGGGDAQPLGRQKIGLGRGFGRGDIGQRHDSVEVEVQAGQAQFVVCLIMARGGDEGHGAMAGGEDAEDADEDDDFVALAKDVDEAVEDAVGDVVEVVEVVEEGVVGLDATAAA